MPPMMNICENILYVKFHYFTESYENPKCLGSERINF